MVLINENYLKLKAGYLFPEIERRVKTYKKENPDKKIISLGIGDVTRPLPEAITKAMHLAVAEMATAEGFHGYGPSAGYDFLREKILKFDFSDHGINLEADEIFVSDGSKCDSANIQEIFAKESRIAIPDPVYPVYLDTNVMAGRTGEMDGSGRYSGILYLSCTAENNFLPPLPEKDPDIIYLCFPNNPTGAVATHGVLSDWVKYAKEKRAIILFDAAYEAFIQDKTLPHSIYEIPGAREVAIELRSFSKNAGFTGTRAAYMVIPKILMAFDKGGKPHAVHALWNRRHNTKFNGVSYPIQRAAEAVYASEGRKQVQSLIDYYMKNAAIISRELKSLNLAHWGSDNAPYIWLKTPTLKGSAQRLTSWEFFDLMLNKANLVGTPGSGFGPSGEGYFRLSAFGNRENVEEAVSRISRVLE